MANKKNGASSLISRRGTYSTTSKSKYISMADDTGKPCKYIPKTKENMQALVRAKGKPDVYSDKRYGKRCIWW